MRIKFLPFLLVLLMSLSCSDDDTTDDTNNKYELLLYGDTWSNVSESSSLEEISFKADMTYRQIIKVENSLPSVLISISEPKAIIEGKWSISDNEISFDTAKIISLGNDKETLPSIDESSLSNLEVEEGLPLGIFVGTNGDEILEINEFSKEFKPEVFIIESITKSELILSKMNSQEIFKR